MPSRIASGLAIAAASAFAFEALRAEIPTPYNTEKSTNQPTSRADVTAGFRMPEGFRVSLFASEPEVQQPIAMAFDPRGRLWVAECYTYAESKVSFATNLTDRILILEDKDNDGHFDQRTVFWDQGRILTSIEVGFGGVFALCPPQLLFIPDRNGDGVPDGEPEVLLDGFTTTTGNHHTFANGLKWGPDGWLWGRIGISSGAQIGTPGAPNSERVEMRGGIWRFHPRHRIVEAVAHGTTNPWGLDWNELGEPFFINTVIGHLWHAIPGGHFQRMHGDDVNPHSYELIGQHADHYHFDTGAGWTKSRAAMDGSSFAAGSDGLGGGHAHCGLLIYQGDNWPAAFRGSLFTINLHGRRINTDLLERSGSGYVGHHGRDFLQVGDPWFRGLDLIQGPDGGVFVNDWSDTGECHDSDGVHRTSGRIYKITYGTPKRPAVADVSALTEAELVTRLFDSNEWLSRMARRVIADRASRGLVAAETRHTLETRFDSATTTTSALRALWALNAAGAAPADWLAARLNSGDEHLQSWVVRLLAETVEGRSGAHAEPLARLAALPGRPLLHLYLASALQKLPLDTRAPIARNLLQHASEATDHNLPLMIWQGIEPLVAARPEAGVSLFTASGVPTIRQFITRRLAETIDEAPQPIARLLAATAGDATGSSRQDFIRGLSDALRGWSHAQAPAGWSAFARPQPTDSANTLDLLRELNVVFGDGRALDDLRKLVADSQAGTSARRSALRTLVGAKATDLGPLLKKAADEDGLRIAALVGLLELGDPDGARLAVRMYTWTGLEDRPTLLASLAKRTGSASTLLDAVASRAIAPSDITPSVARQIASLNDSKLTRRLEELWGTVRSTAVDKRSRIDRLKSDLTPARLQSGNLSAGRASFNQLCAPCHKLYGEGGAVGPDLTGSGRANVDYLLENIVDPNAVVPADYRMAVVTLKDGRVLNGLVRNANERTVTVISPAEQPTLERRAVESINLSEQSMMPEGLVDGLKPDELRDLIAYLMHPRQVPLPSPSTGRP